RSNFLYVRSVVVPPIVAEGAEGEEPAQDATQRHGEGRADSQGEKTTAASGGCRRPRPLPRNRPLRWSVQQLVKKHDAQTADREGDEQFQRSDQARAARRKA